MRMACLTEGTADGRQRTEGSRKGRHLDAMLVGGLPKLLQVGIAPHPLQMPLRTDPLRHHRAHVGRTAAVAGRVGFRSFGNAGRVWGSNRLCTSTAGSFWYSDVFLQVLFFGRP